MIKYRPHKGKLAEAIAEAKEFETVDEMKEFLYKEWNEGQEKELFSKKDIVIGNAIGDDDRIGWKNVRCVCVKRLGDEDFMKEYGCPQCIAWCGE